MKPYDISCESKFRWLQGGMRNISYRYSGKKLFNFTSPFALCIWEGSGTEFSPERLHLLLMFQTRLPSLGRLDISTVGRDR